MIAIAAVTTTGETSALCHSVGLARASFYRRRRRPVPPAPSRAPSPRALATNERQAILDTLHSERFVDQSPAEVHATLLEEQRHLGSVRTMYRVLAEADEVRERRAQARHPAYVKPELVATAPNQVWSWDITKLKGPIPSLYYSLYVILDLFSRYVVGWMVAFTERARLAERLIAATCRKQSIGPQQLTIHADRGAPMRSKLVAELFADLTIGASHSRPRVSNDNPFSEAQFRTFKYRTGVSRTLRLPRTRARHLARPVHVVQRRPPSQRPELSHTGRRALRPRAGDPHPASPHPPRGLRRASGAIRQRTATPGNPADRGVDQSAGETDPPAGPRPDDRHAGRPAAWGDQRAIRDPSGSLDRAPRPRGVATVNAESGCLKRIDTARPAHAEGRLMYNGADRTGQNGNPGLISKSEETSQ